MILHRFKNSSFMALTFKKLISNYLLVRLQLNDTPFKFFNVTIVILFEYLH